MIFNLLSTCTPTATMIELQNGLNICACLDDSPLAGGYQ